MLDTNAINDLLDGKLASRDIEGKALYITHIQLDEVKKASVNRATELLEFVEVIGPKEISTSSSAWGVSSWGKAKWAADSSSYPALLQRLRELDRATGKSARDPANQPRDALIAETTIEHSLVLISNDSNLRMLVLEFGGSAIDLRT